MRFFRLYLMISGLLRSFSVMERMMASSRAKAFSSTLALARAFLSMPGSIPITSWMLPMFLICRSCSKKSVRVIFPARSFFSSAAACFSSKASCAFSTRVSTSPMPRMREAMRSG